MTHVFNAPRSMVFGALTKPELVKRCNWLGVRLIGTKANRDAIGARVTYQAGDLTRSRMKVGGGSFLSSHDPRLVLGIGGHKKMDWIEVKWPQPSGRVQRISALPLNRYITIEEGKDGWR
jgi:enediyne biosynthesis protein E4